MSILFISSSSKPSALVSTLNFFPNQKGRLCTGKCSTPMAQLRPLSCSHRITNRRQRSVELSPETQNKAQNSRATQQAIWFRAHFLGASETPEEPHVFAIPPNSPAFYSCFYNQQGTTAQQYPHHRQASTEQQPEVSRRTHSLYFSRAGFARKGFSRKLSKGWSQRRLKRYTALHLCPFTCVSWNDTWSS